MGGSDSPSAAMSPSGAPASIQPTRVARSASVRPKSWNHVVQHSAASHGGIRLSTTASRTSACAAATCS